MLLGQRHTPSARISEPGGGPAGGVSVGASGVLVGNGVFVGLGVSVGGNVVVGAGVGVDVRVAVGLGVTVGSGVLEGLGVFVGALVLVDVAVAVSALVAAAVGVLLGVAVKANAGVSVGKGVPRETVAGAGDEAPHPAKASTTSAAKSSFLHMARSPSPQRSRLRAPTSHRAVQRSRADPPRGCGNAPSRRDALKARMATDLRAIGRSAATACWAAD